MARTGKIARNTNETQIQLELDLDGGAKQSSKIDTGVAFMDHMLQQLAKHSRFNLKLKCQGDTEVDDHHTLEDLGICLGLALDQALGDKRGLVRFASSYAPLDEALSRTVVDISGRPNLSMHTQWTASRIGSFDVQLVREFFQGFANGAKLTLHIDCLRGINCHHQVESVFKSYALALSKATRLTNDSSIPSTKGVL